MTGAARFRMRLRGMLRKEVLQIIRDPSSIALAVVMPLILLVVFGYGVSLDAEHVGVALVSDDTGTAAEDLVQRFELSPHFQLRRVPGMAEATALLSAHEVDTIVRLHEDFSARLLSTNRASVQAIVNGVDANRARLIQGYIRNVIGEWSVIRRARGEPAATPPVTLQRRVWFNESTESRNFMVPGLITLIMTLIGILLTALVVAREWERGTMEPLLVTPVRRIDILLGKILPYYFLGMLGMGLSVLVAITLFGVPFRGSLFALVTLSSLFLLASLGFGLVLSAAIRVQFVAAQVSIVAGFLPAFFLSGLIFDLESTPPVIQMVSHIVPARYFVTVSHTLFMAGDVWPVLLPNGLVLGGMAVFFIGLAFRNITKQLE